MPENEDHKALAAAVFEHMKPLIDGQYVSRDGRQAKKGAIDPLDDEQLTKMSDAISKLEARDVTLTAELEAEKAAREQFEVRLRTPLPGESASGSADQLDLDRKAYLDVLRYGELADEEHIKLLKTGMTVEQAKGLREAGKTLGVHPSSLKLLSTVSGPAGGYLVPQNIADTFTELLVELDPMRSLADVVTISEGDSWEQPKEGSTLFATSWVAEVGSRAETTSGDIALEVIPVHEMYANPFATKKMLDDTRFNIDAYITKKVTEQMALTEGQAFITGDGVGKPEGLSNGSISTKNSGSAGAFTGDGIWDLVYDLAEFYTMNATFIARRASIGLIRKLKDGQGQYLWERGFGATPATIAGFPYREAPTVPAAASASVSLYFGDFKRGYLIVDRADMDFLRDPFSNKPKIEFYYTKRVGGQVVLAEAMRSQTLSV